MRSLFLSLFLSIYSLANASEFGVEGAIKSVIKITAYHENEIILTSTKDKLYHFLLTGGGGKVVKQNFCKNAIGVVFLKNGLIATECSAVENTNKISVLTSSGEEYDADFLECDKQTEIAVLQVKNELKIGESVFGFKDDLSVFHDVIAAKNDNISSFNINSVAANGSPIIDKNGKLLGIFTGKNVFSLHELVKKFTHNKHISVKKRFGILYEEMPVNVSEKYEIGLFVHKIEMESLAHKIGIQREDIILQINGKKVQFCYNFDDIKSIIVLRNGKVFEIKNQKYDN